MVTENIKAKFYGISCILTLIHKFKTPTKFKFLIPSYPHHPETSNLLFSFKQGRIAQIKKCLINETNRQNRNAQTGSGKKSYSKHRNDKK